MHADSSPSGHGHLATRMMLKDLVNGSGHLETVEISRLLSVLRSLLIKSFGEGIAQEKNSHCTSLEIVRCARIP